MRYLTGLGSPRAWRLFAGASILDLLQPWRRMRVIRTGPIWNRGHQRRVYGIIDGYMRENPEAGYFGKRFAWKDPLPGESGRRRPRGSRWEGVGEGFGQVTGFFGEELGRPLVEYTAARLAELEREGCPCNFIELYVFRTLPGTPPNFEDGHSHFLRPYVALFKMETGPSTRVRADGMPYGAPPATLVGVGSDCALRFTHSWHAGPHVEADGEPRFGIVLNARVYGPRQLAEAVVTS